MRRRARLLICVLLCGLTADAPAQDESDAARDLVLLSAEGPVFVRILLKVDGIGFRARWRDHADSVFTTIDADANRTLDAAEIDQIPAFITSGRRAADTRTLLSQIDTRPAYGQVGREEFQAFALDSLDRSFVIRPYSTTRTQAVGLFPRLDRDGNGELSSAEIEAGYRTLRADDIDANDVLGIDELLPPQNFTASAEVREADSSALDLPFLELRGDSISSQRAAEILLNRYAQPETDTGDDSRRGLTQDRLGGTDQAMRQFDKNGDGRLDVAELAALLSDPRPRVRFLVELKVRGFGRPGVSLTGDRDQLVRNVRQTAVNRMELSLAGIDLTLSAARPRTTADDARRFFNLRFRVADADKNQYVDAQEFAALNLPATDFTTVDGNGDGQIFQEELEAYVDRSNGAADSQLVATVYREGRTLFQMLDENTDLRLTRREFQEAPARLAELDADHNGRIAAAEFRHRYNFSFRSGEPPLLPSGQAMQATGRIRATPIVRDETTGPEWFRRMDRNRDGDVSQREFLGSPAFFDRLDRDHDGLLTADEAEQADQRE